MADLNALLNSSKTKNESDESAQSTTTQPATPEAPLESNTDGPTNGGAQTQTNGNTDGGLPETREGSIITQTGNSAAEAADFAINTQVGDGSDANTIIDKVNPFTGAERFTSVDTDSRGATSYTSHPIENFQVGPYVFEKTILTLEAADAAKFEKFLESMPPVEKARVRKIDTSAAESLIADLRTSSTTRDFDSSVGADALSRLRNIGPTIGTGRLEDLNRDSDSN